MWNIVACKRSRCHPHGCKWQHKTFDLLFRRSPTVFSVGRPQASPMWLADLLKRSGDIEENSGPIWTCTLRNKTINKNQTSILCHDLQQHWVHKNCTNTTLLTYKQNRNWTCSIHTITSTQKTNPALPSNKQSQIITQHKAKPTLKPSQTQTTQANKNKTLIILQVNINGIKNKLSELTRLA